MSADLDRIQAAHDAGTLRTTGTWTSGQIFDHCAKFMEASIDGFINEQGVVIKLPFVFKLLGTTILKPTIGRVSFKPGIKIPVKIKGLVGPTPDQSFDQGMAAIRAQIARVDAGEEMTMPSPLFGKLSHNKWVTLHLDHCRLHMGFIQTDAG